MPIVQTGRLGQSKGGSQKRVAVEGRRAVVVAYAGSFEDRKAWAEIARGGLMACPLIWFIAAIFAILTFIAGQGGWPYGTYGFWA